jgi:hypothetical protein
MINLLISLRKYVITLHKLFNQINNQLFNQLQIHLYLEIMSSKNKIYKDHKVNNRYNIIN